MILSKRTLKQIRNLENVCEFDMEKETAAINIHFRDVSEIIDEKQSLPGNPVISIDIIELIKSKLVIIPEQFKAIYYITIDDYKNYDPVIIKSAIRQASETMNFRQTTAKKTKLSRMTAFVFIGILMIIPIVLNAKYGWFTSFGKMVSAGMACLLELIFELNFEDGIAFFTVSRFYEMSNKHNQNRIISINLN